jgi:hypothetical protein
VWASPQKFRQLLGGEPDTGGSYFPAEYQRIYGWRATIDDNALETVDVLVSPQDGGGG